MNWNDYEAVWKRQELPTGADADLANLRETFETKRRKLAATLLVRDFAEGATGLFVSGLLTYFWWRLGKEGWPMVFAILLVLGVSGFFARERYRAHRGRLGADVPLLTKIEADIAELGHQRHLLLNIWWWYLSPLAAAIIIVCAAMLRLVPHGTLASLRQHPTAVAWIVFYFAVVLPLCFWGAWLINRRAVRKSIEPRLAELEKLHRDLLSSE